MNRIGDLSKGRTLLSVSGEPSVALAITWIVLGFPWDPLGYEFHWLQVSLGTGRFVCWWEMSSGGFVSHVIWYFHLDCIPKCIYFRKSLVHWVSIWFLKWPLVLVVPLCIPTSPNPPCLIMEDTLQSRSSRHNRVGTHRSSQRLWQHAKNLHKSAPVGVLELKSVPVSNPEASTKRVTCKWETTFL